MRMLLSSWLAAITISSSAFADPAPRQVRGETIEIFDHAPPKVLPKPFKNYRQIAAPYSDYAIEHDTWAKAYVLLDINARGDVDRVKLLKHPGAGLDQIAIDFAFGFKFSPAQDDQGHAIGSQLIWPIEWPSYWWLIAREGVSTGLIDSSHVPCPGSGPWHMGSVHPTYKDCKTFKLRAVREEPWIEKSTSAAE
jgi:hypothetical protein